MGALTSFWAATDVRFTLNDSIASLIFGGGNTSSTGERVSSESALSYSPWWRGINLICNDVAKIPAYIYRRNGSGKERDAKHQSYYLIRRKPNVRMNDVDFKRLLNGHAMSNGNGYAYIFRRRDSSPEELLPLEPTCTEPTLDSQGKLWYVTEMPNGEQRKLARDDVLHVKGFSTDGLKGINVVRKAVETIGLGLAARKSQAVLFKNGSRPGVVLETPNILSDKSKLALAEQWEKMHSGIENRHRTAILDRGLKMNQMAFSNEDLQLTELLQFSLIDVANFLGIPPHKVGHPSRTAYASLEQENQSYLDEALDPWLCNWEAEIWDKLLTEQEKEDDTHVVEFLRQALLRANLTDRGNYYRTALGGRPWMTQNEVRGLENLNPAEDPVADEILDPLNMGRPGGDQQSPAVEPEPTQDAKSRVKPTEAEIASARAVRAAARGVIADAVGRLTRRIGTQARRAATDTRKFCDWLDTFRRDEQETATAMLAPGMAWVIALGSDQTAESVARRVLGLLHGTLSTLAESKTAAQLPDAVGGFLSFAEATFPDTIARELIPEVPNDKATP